MPREDLRALLDEIVDRNVKAAPGADFLIDVIFSGGLFGETMTQSGKGAHLYIAVQRMVPPEAELYEKGVALATYQHQRMWPDVKLLNYVAAVIAHQTVVPGRDAWDVLYVSPSDGRTLLEGSTFSIFFVDSAGLILTPRLDSLILDSVTRRAIFEIVGARKDLEIREATLYQDDIPSLREAFVASTARNVLPVTRIDHWVIGDGTPGPVTRVVATIFKEYLESY
jgi:branched-subunit amino acid aminotransferase/4-amino-4-deoxychorismate lyase